MRIRLTTEMVLPAGSLFALLHDYRQRGRWDTFVPSAELLDATQAAPGVIVRCTDKFGLSMDTQYVGFRPPRLATIRMVRGPRLFQRLSGSWRIEELGPCRCRLFVTYNIKTNPASLQSIVEPVVVSLFWLQTWRRLRALKRFVDAQRA